MAKAISGSNYQKSSFYFLGFFCLVLSLQKGHALQFTVGGVNGWTVPKYATGNDYNRWAERTRFQTGDSLLFMYKPAQDSVLLVNKQDYENCTSSEALATYDDGHTVYTFNRSGYFYFISGNKENCLNNEKLIVDVLAERSNHSRNITQTITASPPPSDIIGMAPSPAPAGQGAPPTGPMEINPGPAPADEEPPSAASSVFMSFSGSFGALFLASYLVSGF